MWRVFSAFILLMVASACGNPKPVINSIDDLAKYVNTFDDLAKYEVYSYDDLIRLGARNADDLLRVGVRNADDLSTLRVSSVDALWELGLRNQDELAKVSLNSPDDLARIGITNLDYAGQAAVSDPNMASMYYELSKIVSRYRIAETMITSTDNLAYQLQQSGALQSEADSAWLKELIVKIACETSQEAIDGNLSLEPRVAIIAGLGFSGVDPNQYPGAVETTSLIYENLQAIRSAKGIPGAFRDALLTYCAMPDLN